jgi:hypothetical protein
MAFVLIWVQGRREGVEGMTVLRGPVPKKGPAIIVKKEEKNKNQDFWVPNSSGPKDERFIFYKEKLATKWGPHFGFTGPSRALDAPVWVAHDWIYKWL